jgi:predicted ATPase/class 3 adenylate cyclase
MPELPTGTVTFLFTDLEVSTRLWDLEPDAMRLALARHDEILRDAVGAHGGVIVKGRGDGVHAVFSTADAAVRAAIACELAMASESWAVSEPLRARVGLHTGVAEMRDGDYFGSAVNRAARLEAIAHGGQIVCSQATADLARDVLAEGVGFVDLGEHRLRDLSRPERVFQVSALGLDAEFAALASVDAFPGNLPLQLSSFIERERELVRVTGALEDARVVVLTGVGGVGKTRLALQVAAQMLPRFREGAWVVELAAVRDEVGVGDAVAAVFGVSARSGQSIAEALVEFLRWKQLLLVLDNCEHLLEAVADLVELLQQSCAGVVVLATSREGLSLDGEQDFTVPSLSLPADRSDLEEAERSDAVVLFVQRAQRADVDFVLTAENVDSVGQVCRRLDGVPLAIELAAAQVAAMTLPELAGGLDKRFEMLTGGRRRAVQRHQTLRAAIDWSFELCTESEQRLLGRLAVFASGCSREAVEVVCAGETVDANSAFSLLRSLVAKSLVVAERDATEARYRLLETVREYGEEYLIEHGEIESMRRRHAEYFCDLLYTLIDAAQGPQQVDMLRRLDAERENLLAAMNYAVDANDVEIGLRLLTAPRFHTGLVTEGYVPRLPTDVLALPAAHEHRLYPLGLAIAATYALDPQARNELCDAALAHRDSPDPVLDIMVADARAGAAVAVGDWIAAGALYEQAASLARSAGGALDEGNIRSTAASSYVLGGDHDRALPLARQGLALVRDNGAPTHQLAWALAALAGALIERDPEQARQLLRESAQVRSALDPITRGMLAPNLLIQSFLVAAQLDDWDMVLDLAPRAIRGLHWLGNYVVLSGVLNVVARALVVHDPESAAVIQGAARRIAMPSALSLTHDSRAQPPARSDVERDSTPAASIGVITQLRRTTTSSLHKTLNDTQIRALRAHGEAMDNEDTVNYALTAIERAEHATQPT